VQFQITTWHNANNAYIVVQRGDRACNVCTMGTTGIKPVAGTYVVAAADIRVVKVFMR